MNKLSRPQHHSRLNFQLRADLSWWVDFLSVFNGKTFFVDSDPVASEEFSTDACPIGGGGFFRGDWFYLNWEVDQPAVASAHINLKETFTVLAALDRWKHDLRDKCIVVRSDNHTTISALNKGTCRNQQIMQWLREIFWLSATYNFRITARYIPSKLACVAGVNGEGVLPLRLPLSFLTPATQATSKSNTVADAISRLHDPRVFSGLFLLFPQI